MLNIAIIGAGWRAKTYYKIIKATKKYNIVVGVIRNGEKAKEFENEFGVKTINDIQELKNYKIDFAVSCVNKASIYSVCEELSLMNIPVLTETPLGFTKEDGEKFLTLSKTAKIQVAEQYFMQPRFIALKKIIELGEIGEVNHVYLSCAHEYHAVSLIRKLLSTGDKVPTVKSIKTTDTYAEIYGRNGKIPQDVKDHYRTLSFLDFGEKTAVYDFSGQYFAEIRKPKVCIQGTLGEIDFNEVTKIYNEQVFSNSITYRYFGNGGNLYPTGIDTITYCNEILYKNTESLSLSDEELAITSALDGMSDYLLTGKEFYSVKDAVLDTEISRKL